MKPVQCLWLGRRDYAATWTAMKAFTNGRDESTVDQIWFLEHPPVFTQGQAGKPEHLLTPGDIPVVATDRGGQVTYHGPGQLVVYPLLDLRHLQNGRGAGIRRLVESLEQAMIDCLARYGIDAAARRDAPGVYVQQSKIGSIGLRVRRHCCYHGIALNVSMDLEPFQRINPCGYQGLNMTQVSDLGGPADVTTVAQDLQRTLGPALGMTLSRLETGCAESPPGALAQSA